MLVQEEGLVVRGRELVGEGRVLEGDRYHI
jgi:hypothetical protein